MHSLPHHRCQEYALLHSFQKCLNTLIWRRRGRRSRRSRRSIYRPIHRSAGLLISRWSTAILGIADTFWSIFIIASGTTCTIVLVLLISL